MSKIRVETFTAPAHWACYYINGDQTYLTDEEMKQADDFQKWTGGEIVDTEDPPHTWFSCRSDASQFTGPIGHDICAYIVHIRE